MENEIDDNLDALSGVTGRLNALARATGREVDEQNERLKIIEGKVHSHFVFWLITATLIGYPER